MGTVCTKVCSSVDERSDFFGTRRYNQIKSVKNRTNAFAVTIECYCVPSTLLLEQPNNLEIPDADCRSVMVATINIENREDKVKQLNSVIYTPVLQWGGIDIKQQVPKFLPMNIWPGSYTVFGFCNSEDSREASVTLIGKVGTEQVCLEEPIDTERCLTSNQLENLSKHLEKELQKMNMFSQNMTKSQELTQGHHEAEQSEASVLAEEVIGQRDSLDTGYISNKRSLEQSVFSVQCVGNTSDSEDGASLREKKTKEKRLKTRRKDTPAHIVPHITYSPLTQEIKPSPLQEESEEVLSSDGDTSPSQRHDTIPNRPVSARGFISTYEAPDDLGSSTAVKEELKIPGKLSKSCRNQHDDENYSLDGQLFLSDPDAAKKPPGRRKKRSIISRMGGVPIKAELHISQQKVTEQLGKNSDSASDADDEEDLTNIENERASECLSVDNRIEDRLSKLKSTETDVTNIADGERKETTSVSNMNVCPNDQSVAMPNLKSTSDDVKNEEKESSPCDKGALNERQFSYSKMTETQSSPVRGILGSVCDLQGAGEIPTLLEPAEALSEPETVQGKIRTKQAGESAKEKSVRERKKLERKETGYELDDSSRPRSRTFSSKNVLSFGAAEGRFRYTRPSKSVSLPKKGTVSTNK